MTVSAKPVYEFVFYSLNKIKKEEYHKNYLNFKNEIKNLDGCLEFETFNVADNDLLILDFGKWKNLEAAQKADNRVQTETTFKKFFEPMNEIIFFENMYLIHSFIKEDTEESKLVELNVYIADCFEEEKYNRNRKLFYERVKEKADGFVKTLSFVSVEDKNVNIDLMFWESREKANNAHKLLNDDPYFRAMKKTVTELKIWKQLEYFYPLEKERNNG
ncbi:MAG: hypothetical protein ACEPO8_06685 [Rhodothermaceae bacterium]